MRQPTATRVSELEKRVSLLTRIVIVQAIALAYFCRVLGIMVFAFLVLLPILAFTHQKIPALARRCGRLFAWASKFTLEPQRRGNGIPTV